MNIQLSVLKEPYDPDSPYLLEVLKIEMLAESGPPSGSVDIRADSTFESMIDSRSYASGEEVVFRLLVPEFVQNTDAMFVELDQDVRLELLSPDYDEVLFTSDSKNAFRSGAAPLTGNGLTDGSRTVSPSDLGGTAKVCRGSCITLEAFEDVYFVRIRNITTSERTVRLWAYGDYLSDLNEDINDGFYDAPEVDRSVSAGAIETVGDIDYWLSPYTESFSFETSADGIELEVHRMDYVGDGGVITGGPYLNGESFEALSGEYLRVRAVDPDEAASSGWSAYFLTRIF